MFLTVTHTLFMRLTYTHNGSVKCRNESRNLPPAGRTLPGFCILEDFSAAQSLKEARVSEVN